MGDSEADVQLFEAAKRGDFDALKQSIVKNANVNSPNKFMGWTPLHVAVGFARENAVDIIKYLIAAKADIALPDNNGRTALHLAARSGKTTALEYLVSANADLNLKTSTGATSLALACGSGNFEAMKLLMDMGADMSTKDNNGQTALDRAEDKGYDKISAYLKGEEYVEEVSPQMAQLNAMLGSLTQLSNLKKGTEADAMAVGIDIEEVKRRARQQNQTPPRPSPQPPRMRQSKSETGLKQELEELRFDHDSLKKVVMEQQKAIAALQQELSLLKSNQEKTTE